MEQILSPLELPIWIVSLLGYQSCYCNTIKSKYGLFISLLHISSNVLCFIYAEILGGGFSLGSLVIIMEDAEAPHHMLLMRNFMSQGLVQNQPLLYVSPSSDPKAFLGTLPNLVTSKDEKSRDRGHDQEQVRTFYNQVSWSPSFLL